MKTEERLKEEKKLTDFLFDEEREFAPWLCQLCAAAVSFSLSQLNCLGSLSPFCVSFCAGTDYGYVAGALIGGISGYFLAFDWKTALRYSAALLFCAVVRFLIEKKFPFLLKTFTLPLVGFLSCLLPAAVFSAFGDEKLILLLFGFCEAVIAFCSVCLFERSERTQILRTGIANLSVQDIAGVGLCLCILLLCSSGLSLGPIVPARIFAVIVVLFAAHYKGPAVASLFGVCAAFSLSVSAQTRFLFPVFSLGALCAGVFSPLGQLATSVAFSVSAVTLSFLNGFSETVFWALLEICAGAAIFAVIPSRKIFALHAELEKGLLSSDDQLNRRVCASLKRAAETVNEVSSIVTNVSARLDNVINPEINRIFAKLQQNICFGCSFKNECWSEKFNETSADVLTLTGLRSKEKERTELEKRCPRANALVSQISSCYSDFATGLASKMKVKEMRSLVSDQFSSIAQFLSEFAVQMSNSRVVDNTRSRALKTALSDADIFVDCVNYFTNPNGRITIEVNVLENAFELNLKRMKTIFEASTKRSFEKPEIAIMELRSVITFEEKAVYKVLFGSCQIPFGNNTVCGDSIAKLRDMNGNEIALISDGMGTGSRAAVDGTMTATLMEKLLSCSFSFESALKTVNCALMVKSTDESIATVDGISVNVYSGETVFYKAGAAVSLIRRGKEIAAIEEQSLPVGIIRDVCFAKKATKLETEDIVLLLSDGATFGDCGWINDELLAWSTNSMDDLASHIASLARLRSSKENEDDITVVALKVIEN